MQWSPTQQTKWTQYPGQNASWIWSHCIFCCESL
jgi:hypothetical protein